MIVSCESCCWWGEGSTGKTPPEMACCGFPRPQSVSFEIRMMMHATSGGTRYAVQNCAGWNMGRETDAQLRADVGLLRETIRLDKITYEKEIRRLKRGRRQKETKS